MTSLSFPDINVWLAILMADHEKRPVARSWWESEASRSMTFTRLTQIGVLRLLTTSSAMNGNPLTMGEAWAAYDRLYEDDRVNFLSEPPEFEERFRLRSIDRFASPKLWADAYLLAFSESRRGSIVTFDKALAGRATRELLLS